MQLSVEALCDRTVPSTMSLLSGTTLMVVGDGGDDVVTVNPAVNGTVTVTTNGVSTPYAGLTQIVVLGNGGADDITNNTGVAFMADGGSGDDTLMGGVGVNVIDGGDGKDVIYSLLGQTTVVSADNSADRVYVSAGATLSADGKDQVSTFFADGRVPGSGQAQLVNGVLYLTPPNGGSFTQIDEVKGQIVVTTDWGFNLSFDKNDVDAIAYFGGSGNDVYLNNSKVEEAAYGSAGNDMIVGGFGSFNLLKGSGGNDVLQSRGKDADLSGNGGADLFLVGTGTATVRMDALDLVTGLKGKDLVVGN
jgi:Ca2+-binding RTX toxin-like protein